MTIFLYRHSKTDFQAKIEKIECAKCFQSQQKGKQNLLYLLLQFDLQMRSIPFCYQ